MSYDACENQKQPGEREADAIQQFFRRPFFLSLTIGIPFCGFKLLFGLNAVREGADTGHYLTVFGIIIVVWAIADLFMNISRSLSISSTALHHSSTARLLRLVALSVCPWFFLRLTPC